MKLKRCIIIIGILSALLLGGCTIFQNQQEKVYKVGIMSGLDFFVATADGFKAKMTELGYVGGENIVYNLRRTNFDPVKEETYLKEFVANDVDLILSIGTEASLMAKDEAKEANIPVIFTNANIEGVSLVDSVKHPGGHVTGVRYPGPDIAVKRFEIMIDMLPSAKRLLIPYQDGYPIVESQMALLHPIAQEKNITLIEIPATDGDDLKTKLDNLDLTTKIDGILFIPEPLAVSPDSFPLLGEFSSKHNIPMGGALFSMEGYKTVYGVATNSVSVGEQAAILAHKIFGGIPPGDIPVVSAESYFQLDYNAAQDFGIELDEGLIAMANEVIR